MKTLKNILPQHLINILRIGREKIHVSQYLFVENLPQNIIQYIINKRQKSQRHKIQPSKDEHQYYSMLNKSEFLCKVELQKIQLKKFKELIAYAYENVPFYEETMKLKNITPNDFKTLNDISKLPVISKDDIRKQPEKFISKEFSGSNSRQLTPISTGGSTGTPMLYQFDQKMIGVRKAHWWRWSKFAGVDLYNDKMIYIGGDAESKYRKPNNFKGIYNSTHTRLTLSANSMSPQVIDRYIQTMQEFKGDYMRGYASAVYLLAIRMNERNITIPLKAILTSSDTLYPQYRDVIRKAFNSEVFDHYGQNEDILTATECDYHNGFHINTESCIAETVDINNEVVVNESGFLVSTHLENYAMPLIRYKVGDVGKLDNKWVRCKCGRSHQKLVELIGRDDEIIISPDGRQVACGSMNQPMKLMGDTIVKCQFIQNTIDKLTVKIVTTNKWNKKSEKQFIGNLKQQVGNELKIKLELVDNIPTRPNGKYQLIVSNIQNNK